MEFVKVAAASDLLPGQMREVSAKGTKLLLANIEGGFYAIARKCPHLGGNLCKGKLQGAEVKCPLHGARFDVRTGKAIADAKLLFLKMKVRDARSFPVQINGADILVGV
ncbi:MAG TPA: Rieske 2Fe-2S domain-containing protein [Alphaproteobacteria bacterium]|nr:Rieske 2Fe-2S domain-containing protein [Alphaproteobacteria bacterium]